jgi:hypothetical protein
MTSVQPLLLGYIRADALTTDRELARSTAELAAFAYRQGYALGTVFIERTEKVPAAFEALMSEAERTGADAVVMPGMPPKIMACAQTRRPTALPESPMPGQVEWSDGTVSLRWKGDTPSITFWQAGIPAVEAVHGHGGATEVLYVTTARPPIQRLDRR